LESAAIGGAILIKVMDSAGNPVSGATINLTLIGSSTISNTDTSNNSGALSIVGVPPAQNSYHVVVSKTGYSSDETYATSSSNPDPSKPDLTVLDNQVTEASFMIDKLSSLSFRSVDIVCTPVGGVNFTLSGAKKIGESIPKYLQSLSTDSTGMLFLNNIEWDTYDISSTDVYKHIAGITPFNPISLNPNNDKDVELVIVPKSAHGLLIAVKDIASGLPLSDALVRVVGPGGYDRTAETGRGYIEQTDWSLDSGENMYFASGMMRLTEAFGEYPPFGQMESGIFDTGASSNFYELSWSPQSQPVDTGDGSVRFQIATNAEVTATSTWDFLGPDGSSFSYYSVPGTPISPVHNGDRYLKYRVSLSTETAAATPAISNVSFTYTSDCIPPGQVFFSGLDEAEYNISVSKSGYTSASDSVDISKDWQMKTIELSI
jgi:hypothetical protein